MEEKEKTDSGFNLDISAGKDETSSNLDVSDSPPSSFVFSTPDVKPADSYSFQFSKDVSAPQSTIFSPQASLDLPEQVLFQPTEQRIQPQVQPSQSTLIGTNLNVKVDAEEVLKKTNEVDKAVQAVRKDVESLSSQMRYPDARLNQRDNFEEKITIPAANVIFENRKLKSTKYPDWI